MDKKEAHIRANEYLRFWFTPNSDPNREPTFEGIEFKDFENLIEYVLTGDKKLITEPDYGHGN